MFEEKEKRIAELRTIDATKQQLMGANGKLAIIARNMGEPVIAQNEGSDGFGYSSTESTDYYQSLADDWDQSPSAVQSRIPYMEANGEEEPTGAEWRSERNYSIDQVSMREIGWLFDGLNRGMHLEIRLNLEDYEIIVRHKGYLVYKEVNGELRSYIPKPEWEDKISSLYESAKKSEKKKLESAKQEQKLAVAESKINFMEKMKSLWGDIW